MENPELEWNPKGSLATRLFKRGKNYEYLWKHSFLTRDAVEKWNTLLFVLLRRMPEEVPLYRVSPPFMFLKEEVESFHEQHSDEVISRIAVNLGKIRQALERRYNIELIVMPIPNKYTIYHKLIREDRYDLFLPRLGLALEKKGIRTINLYPRFVGETELLYFPTDTHWNAKGVAIAVEESLKVLSPYFSDKQVMILGR